MGKWLLPPTFEVILKKNFDFVDSVSRRFV